MRKSGPVLALALLAGCATNNMPSPAAATAPAVDHHEDATAADKLMHWPSNILLDFYDIFSLNFGTGKNDYDFGAHAQFTKLFRVGVLDWADLELLGIFEAIDEGGESVMQFDQAAGDYQVGMKLGAGAGAAASADLYEIYDWAVGVITFNQVNPSGDH